MTEETSAWCPRKRLRTLHGLQARSIDQNIAHSGPGRTVYFAIWSHVKCSAGEHEAKCVYISEQVPLSYATEWLPLGLGESALPPEILHGLASGLLHLHVYVVPADNSSHITRPQLSGPGHPSLETLEVRKRPPALSPLHPEDQEEDQGSDAGKEEFFSGDEGSDVGSEAGSLKHLQQNPAQPALEPPEPEPDTAHFVSFKKFLPPEPATAKEYQLTRRSSGESPLHPTQEVADRSLCEELDLPGELVLATSVDLEHLDCIGTDLAVLDQAPPGPKLLFQLAGGSYCVWPPMPESFKLAELASKAADATSAPAPQPDTAEIRPGGWGIFRRSNFGSMPDLLEKDAPGAGSLTNPDGNRTLREQLSAGKAETPSTPVGLSLADLQQRMHELADLQSQKHEAIAHAKKALRTLELAMRTRETVRAQQARLGEVRARVEASKAAEASSRRRTRALKASSAAARELMRAQTVRLSDAFGGLEVLWQELGGPEAVEWQTMRGDWRALHRKLVARRCRLAADLQHIFGVRPRAVSVVEAPENGFLWQQLDRVWATVPVTVHSKGQPRRSGPREDSTGPAEGREASSRAGSVAGDSDSGLANTLSELSVAGSQIREMARLSIGALDLEPSLWRQKSGNLAALSWDSETEEELKAAAALGYAAHVTQALACYLNVPLKYPLRAANSRSAVQERQSPIQLLTEISETASQDDTGESVPEYGLYPEGSEQTRFSYAIFLLNKDLEQLLNVHGLTSVGPSHVLQNLYKLLSAAATAVVQRSSH